MRYTFTTHLPDTTRTAVLGILALSTRRVSRVVVVSFDADPDNLKAIGAPYGQPRTIPIETQNGVLPYAPSSSLQVSVYTISYSLVV